jgi:hypothetical protein
MRARLFAAIAQPILDLETASLKLDRFRRPVAFVSAAQVRAQQFDDALEVISFGLALAQVYVESREAAEEEEES